MADVLRRKRAPCLLQIIETGSVRGAADVGELDPSVVSRAVAKLGQDIGLALLERRGRGVVATDAGRLLALFARRQQDPGDTFLAEVNNLKNARRGHVEVSLARASSTWCRIQCCKGSSTNSFKVLWEFAALGLGYSLTPFSRSSRSHSSSMSCANADW